jgi:hypothetical protein
MWIVMARMQGGSWTFSDEFKSEPEALEYAANLMALGYQTRIDSP